MTFPDKKAALHCLEKLTAVPLFTNVGRYSPDNSELPMNANTVVVKSWKSAVTWARKDRSWRWAAVEAMNDWCSRLAAHKGIDWYSKNINKLTLEIVKRLPEKLQIIAERVTCKMPGRDASVVLKKAREDLCGICLSVAYADILPRNFYLELIEPWYLAGHFPCGWKHITGIRELPDLIDHGGLVVY